MSLCASASYGRFAQDTMGLKDVVYFLSSEELEGRLTGSKGDSLAAKYIANRFEQFGLSVFDKAESYYQSYKMRASWGDSLATGNVIGFVPGKDSILRERYVIVGAHFDHLGWGDKSSSLWKGDRKIHYGADDNASGVAGLLSMADYFSKNPTKRTLVFVAFSGEEIGLCGSSKFMELWPIEDTGKIEAMINMDMLGGLQDTVFTLSGTGTAKEALDCLKSVGNGSGLKVEFIKGGHGPSDHAVFYSLQIPVLFFATPPTSTYHTPLDTPDKLNYGGMTKVLEIVGNTIETIGNTNTNWHFTSTGSAQPSMTKGKFKVTLGLMPDINAGKGDGLKAMLVIEGKPAYKAGLRTGDKMISLNGVEINSIEEYMKVLATLKPNSIVKLKAICNGKVKTLKIHV